MQKTYKNRKIQRNLRIIKVLSIVSLLIAGITLIVAFFSKQLSDNRKLTWMFCSMLFIIPLDILLGTKTKKNSFIQETKLNNDLSNTLAMIIISFSPIILLFAYFIISLIPTDTMNKILLDWAYWVGYMSISHSFIWIADIFLIHIVF